jgi:DNA polymerase III delta subunit
VATSSPIVLILGQDSLRADRALAAVLKGRKADPSEVVRIWGDEASFADVFAAASSRSLLSDKTVVLVRRAEKLRGGGKDPAPDLDADVADPETPEVAEEPAGGRKKGGKAPPLPLDLPELDPASCLIFVVRKTDRRFGMWKKISKAAELIDADFLRGKALLTAAMAEARALGLRITDEVLRETVEQSGPSLGRIASEFEKMLLYQGTTGPSPEAIVAVTSAPALYLLSDALALKNRAECLRLMDEAMRQGEAGLRVLAVAHGTIRKLAVFRVLRRAGSSGVEAGAQAGILPFKIADTERASRIWSDAEIARAFSILAEADRRLKLSAPASPALTHALASTAGGGRN